jgi:hypothetical protein
MEANMKPARKLHVFLTSILWISLSACGAYITTPTATLILVSPTPIPPTASPTTILLPIFVTPSTLPTQPVIPLAITPQPTRTDWLPYNPNGSDTGCHEFVATVPVTQAEGVSQEEMIKQLFEMYLDHYKAPEIGGRCRLEDYKIENVLLDKRIAFLANEQNLDYVGSVQYSVQIKEVPSRWVAGNGELANDGWIVNKGLIIGVTKVDDEYVLKILGTGP